LISREDFMFSTGFSGDSAIVDASARRAYGRLSTRELAEKGLFKAAVASASYQKDGEELSVVLEIYNRNNQKPLTSVEELKRTFGVLEMIDHIDRVICV
jgi:hypothetical protein